jgi:hypothetical protein
MGHMHELLTGDFYHQQIESVPEQTWSSAAFLSAAVHGLLGLEREGQTNHLEFAPHLPPQWDSMSVSNIKGSGGTVTMTVARVAQGLELQIENSGSPVELLYSPAIPLGARLAGAEFDGKPVEVRTETNPQDTHATLKLTLPKGRSHCMIRYQGGVSLSVNSPAPLLGEPSKAIKITSAVYKAKSLVLDADVSQDVVASTFGLRTSEKPLHAHGAKLRVLSEGEYELVADLANAGKGDPLPGGYRHIEIVVDFAANQRR